VYRNRVLHPEFGYADTSNYSFPTFLAFVVCGVVAGAIGIALLNSESDRDPMDAMALAPASAITATKPAELATPSAKRPASATLGRKDDKGDGIHKAGPVKPICGESPGEMRERDCTPVRVVRKRLPRAANERPLIAEVPIGHRDGATVLPAPPPAPIAAIPLPGIPDEEPKTAPAQTQTSVAVESAPDATSATDVPPTSVPAANSRKPQSRAHHASRTRGEHLSRYSASRNYVQGGGYARLW
jgi:hypothetical protein